MDLESVVVEDAASRISVACIQAGRPVAEGLGASSIDGDVDAPFVTGDSASDPEADMEKNVAGKSLQRRSLNADPRHRRDRPLEMKEGDVIDAKTVRIVVSAPIEIQDRSSLNWISGVVSDDEFHLSTIEALDAVGSGQDRARGYEDSRAVRLAAIQDGADRGGCLTAPAVRGAFASPGVGPDFHFQIVTEIGAMAECFLVQLSQPSITRKRLCYQITLDRRMLIA